MCLFNATIACFCKPTFSPVSFAPRTTLKKKAFRAYYPWGKRETKNKNKKKSESSYIITLSKTRLVTHEEKTSEDTEGIEEIKQQIIFLKIINKPEDTDLKKNI